MREWSWSDSCKQSAKPKKRSELRARNLENLNRLIRQRQQLEEQRRREGEEVAKAKPAAKSKAKAKQFVAGALHAPAAAALPAAFNLEDPNLGNNIEWRNQVDVAKRGQDMAS
eukprot:6491358-Amphidinium_carterae.9